MMSARFFQVTLLLSCLVVQTADAARPKLYYYGGDMPMVEMMLNMMAAMGMIDKVPPGYMRYGSLWRRGLDSPYGVPGWGAMLGNPWASGVPGLWSGSLPGSYAGRNPFEHEMWGRGINCRVTPCVKAAPLDGVWISSTGEMLGIKRNRIIWSDGQDNHVAGVFAAAPDYLIVQLSGAGRKLPYEYRLQGDQLQLKDAQGKVRRYYRLPGSQYY